MRLFEGLRCREKYPAGEAESIGGCAHGLALPGRSDGRRAWMILDAVKLGAAFRAVTRSSPYSGRISSLTGSNLRRRFST